MKPLSFSLVNFCVSKEPKKANGKTFYDGLSSFVSIKIMCFLADFTVQLFLRAICFQEIEWSLQ